MQIQDIQLEYTHANGFCSSFMDGVCHVKVLPYLSVVQAVEGDYDITLGGDKTHNTGQGGFFVAPANVQQTIVHHADKASGRMTCRWVFLKVKLNGVYDLDERFSFPVLLPTAVRDEMNAVFDALFETNDTIERYIAYFRILRLLLSVGEESARPLPSYIADAATFIRRHYTEKLSVKDIADSVNLSASRFFAVFKSHLGISPMAYLNNYRLSLAVDLLLGTTMTVTEIAAGVGIPDVIYFNKVFKKGYQLSPTAYRAMHRE